MIKVVYLFDIETSTFNDALPKFKTIVVKTVYLNFHWFKIKLYTKQVTL